MSAGFPRAVWDRRWNLGDPVIRGPRRFPPHRLERAGLPAASRDIRRAVWQAEHEGAHSVISLAVAAVIALGAPPDQDPLLGIRIGMTFEEFKRVFYRRRGKVFEVGQPAKIIYHSRSPGWLINKRVSSRCAPQPSGNSRESARRNCDILFYHIRMPRPRGRYC